MSSLPVLQLSSNVWELETRQIDSCLNDPQSPRLQYLLMQEDVFSACKDLSPELSQYFHIPQHLCSYMYRQSDGFFAFEEFLDHNGQLQDHQTWFRVIVKSSNSGNSDYVWHAMTFCSRWDPQSCVILCIGVNLAFQLLLQRTLSQMWSKFLPYSPYSLHVPLLEVIVKMYDSYVWSLRDKIRSVEMNRLTSNRVSRDFSMMHGLLRHAIHSLESLSVSVETLEALQQQIVDFSSEDQQRGGNLKEVNNRIRKQVDCQIRMLRGLIQRSQSLKEKLQNEIALAYNLIAQQDTQAMRTIAVAIFSMSFFNYTPGEGDIKGKWSVSETFWVYWVCAVPLTCLTMAIWYWQQKQRWH